jgi:hypothetical protein
LKSTGVQSIARVAAERGAGAGAGAAVPKGRSRAMAERARDFKKTILGNKDLLFTGF